MQFWGVTSSTESEILEKIAKANNAKDNWHKVGVGGRVKLLRKVIQNFLDRKEEIAQLASKEMGMPITLSRSDVDDSMHYFTWYLDNAEKYLSPEIVFEDEKVKHTVFREPIGVSANITPWNFTISNFVWSVAQSLVSGNVVIYKTSEEVLLSGKLIEEIMSRCDFPEGVFSEIYGDGEVGKILVNGDIDLICFTGSTNTGKYLYKVGAEKFVKVFLELGGSAPGIIFEDADVDRVIDSFFGNRFLYSGQVCDGLKRLIVHKNKLEEVLEKLKEKINQTKVGDALNDETEIGPLVSEKQLVTLEEQVKDAAEKGAKVEIGGERLNINGGFFYKPTVLTNISFDMKVWNEEVFGPVLPVVTFKTDEEAIKLANDTNYSLGGYIFTEDKDKARKVALELKTGMIQINNANYLQPTSPFGGYKDSGIGREHGKFGFYDLTQVKVIAEEK
ncbi:MAG TPA: aldehyde dehydrogenase family protein [Alphaproteobacteria bacterium]|nr:aldehyde dehydrogenase family protein [Alphaproteobacteria bacterium]